MDLLVTARTSKAPRRASWNLYSARRTKRVDALATTEYKARPETLSPEASKELSFREWIVAHRLSGRPSRVGRTARTHAELAAARNRRTTLNCRRSPISQSSVQPTCALLKR